MIKQRQTKHRYRGFTLIELMIAVAVIGIIMSVAYPSFKEQMAKGRRAQAKSALAAGQQWMERFYTENFRYDQNSAGTAVTDSSQYPARFSTVPPSGEGTTLYDLSVVVVDASGATTRDSYTVKAVRNASGPMASDRCGDYLLDSLGRKDLTNYTGFASKSDAIAACW